MRPAFQGKVNPARIVGSLLVDEARLVTRPAFGNPITLERADVEVLFFHRGWLASRLEYRLIGAIGQVHLWTGTDRALQDALTFYGWPVSAS